MLFLLGYNLKIFVKGGGGDWLLVYVGVCMCACACGGLKIGGGRKSNGESLIA